MGGTLPGRASLLGLPTELRVVIFEYALEGAHVQLCHRHINEDIESHHPWSIMHINRQSRAEALPIFYQQVRFELIDGFTEQKLRDWLVVIGEDAVACTKRVVFECYAKCSMYGLTPDTDYCHRKADLDMSRDTWSRLYTPINWLCSNEAHGCWNSTAEDLSRTEICSSWTSTDRTLQATDLIAVWQALTKDNDDSAA